MNLKMLSMLCVVIVGLASVAEAQLQVISSRQAQAETGMLASRANEVQNPLFKAYLNLTISRLKINLPSGSQTDDAMAQTVTASRVAADVIQNPGNANDVLTWYVVPAMSPVIRLAERYPDDGDHAAPITLIAAQDEYEPASIQVFSYNDQSNVELSVSDLTSAQGSVFSRDDLDLKVVKIWYQNGNGWFSYFADVGLQLVPELLLHDENLIRVDTTTQANFARIKEGSANREVWISQPTEIDTDFDHYQPGFADADTLLPVSLEAGRFKQFMLTAHVKKETKPGVYRGRIDVNISGKTVQSLPVILRVLPFVLPMPGTYADVDRPLVVSLMGSWPVLPADHPAILPTLVNQRAHNLLHTAPGLNQRDPQAAQQYVPLMKQAGFQTQPIVHRHGLSSYGGQARTPMTYQELMSYKNDAQAWATFYQKNFGHHDVFIGFGDEPSASWIMNVRPLWRVLNEAGLKSQLAGHEHLFTKGGHMLNLHQVAGSPTNQAKAEEHLKVGFGYTAFYANQHNGSENPAFARRQHGLLSYLSGFTAIHNYQFAYGPWNDRAINLYKPMVLAYPISNGLVDTLAWEGFREGIDDTRYATYLLKLARNAAASGDLDRVYAGRKTLLWLALMDARSQDLDDARLEMIDKILKLTELEKR